MANEDVPRGATLSASDAIAKSAADATAKFNHMVADFKASPEQQLARDRDALARLQSDPYHLNRRLTSEAARHEEAMLQARINDAAAKLESNRLDADPVGAIMKGVVPNERADTSNGSRARAADQIEAVAQFRSQGIPEKMISQLLNDRKPTAEEHRQGKELQAKRMADPEWLKALTAGDELTRIEFMSFCWAVGCYEPAS